MAIKKRLWSPLTRWARANRQAVLKVGKAGGILGAIVAVVGTVTGIWLNLAASQRAIDDQREDRINRAWNLVAVAKAHRESNVGLIEALQNLSKREIDLGRVNLV